MTSNAFDNKLMKPLEPAYLQIIKMIGLVICMIASLVVSVPVGVYHSIQWYYIVLGVPVIAAVLFSLLGWYLKHWYLKYSYHLDDESLAIKRGVFWRHHISVPVSRVQHVDVNSGPLDRPYDLAKLVVNTAGTHYAQTSLPGLSVEEAHDLRDQLLLAQEGDTV